MGDGAPSGGGGGGGVLFAIRNTQRVQTDERSTRPVVPCTKFDGNLVDNRMYSRLTINGLFDVLSSHSNTARMPLYQPGD